MLTPILKYPGGKTYLLPTLQELYKNHKHRRLVETCVGGMSVALGLEPTKALLNDINPHVINLYRWVRKGLVIEIEMENNSETYYKHRARLNECIRNGEFKTAECASIFYYLNRTTFNGMVRFNKKGGFNLPIGQYASVNYKRSFLEYKSTLKGWKFQASDFERLEIEPDDFIYADPPYDASFSSYYKNVFDWGCQVRLAQWLAKHSGPVVASNLATERIVKLYEGLGFNLTYIQAPRRVSCIAEDRKPVEEMLATRNI